MKNTHLFRPATLTLAVVALVAALSMALIAGCGGGASQELPSTENAIPDAVSAVVTDDAGTHVTLTVTEEGFLPASVIVPAGKPVTLVVTRKTERTCATELVMSKHGINLALPLDQAVEATFTPAEAETLTYACGMAMYKGQIVVQ